MTSVDSQVVFITGGAHGIGAEVARRLHAKGAKLVLTDVDAAALAAISGELGGDERVLTVVADVRDLAAMNAAAEQAVEKFGGIDAVLANAGIASYGSVLQVDPQAFQRVIDVNLVGVFHTVRATLPAVIERKRLRADRLLVGGVRGRARHEPLRRLQGRRRTPRQRVAFGGRPPRRHGRLGAHVLDRHARWSATPRPTCRRSTTAVRSCPWPLNKTTSVDDCAAAFVKGIEHRKSRVYCPGWVGCVPLAQAVAVDPGRRERRVRKTAAELLPRMDDEVAALGRPPAPTTRCWTSPRRLAAEAWSAAAQVALELGGQRVAVDLAQRLGHVDLGVTPLLQ